MNRQNPGIGWCDWTWNPVTGCLHTLEECAVSLNCFARDLAENRLRGRFGYDQDDPFSPKFHRDRLQEPLKVKEPSKIFVVDMGDLFGDWVPQEWIEKVLYIVKRCPQHTFLFLTKNPGRYSEFKFPKNAWLGTTITSDNDIDRIEDLFDSAPEDATLFASVEPLTGYIADNASFLAHVDWVIIGAMTGSNAVIPEREWVDILLKHCEFRDIPVFLKDNLLKLFPDLEKRQEFPEVVK